MGIQKFIVINYLLIMGNFSLKANMDPSYPSHIGRYLNCPSWVVYLLRHKVYIGYVEPKDILKDGVKWGAWVTFSQKIEAIQACVGGLKTPVGLLFSQDFLCMYKHPACYLQAVLVYIADARYTLEQKEIALYAISKEGVGMALLEDFYQLYEYKKISLALLELSFAISLVHYTYRGSILESLGLERYNFLERIIKTFPKSAPIHGNLKSFLQGIIPPAWSKKTLDPDGSFGSSYYQAQLPFLEIIRYAERERQAAETMRFGGVFHGLEVSPYFLMVIEHPVGYYFGYFNDSESVENGTRVLRDPSFNSAEKAMAIFGASQLGVTSSEESRIYASFINSACEWYRKGQLSVGHLYQLFRCEIPGFYEHPFTTFYKYPFFILDYKDKSIQAALDKFIAEPTIPDGIKALARKVKNGTLATKEEMAYMEGYRQFRKTHFTLYETIPPRGE